jgi:hypothetical protein
LSAASLEPDHAGHLRALAEGGVEFVLIGGLAVAVHGHARATVDTDVVCEGSSANLGRLAEVLRELDAQLPGAPPALDPLSPTALDGANARFETRLGQLHVVQAPEGAASFEELRTDAVAVEAEPGLTVQVCSYEHLVAMKEALGRTQDRADLEALEQARGASS